MRDTQLEESLAPRLAAVGATGAPATFTGNPIKSSLV
jgi:hypothetical protein